MLRPLKGPKLSVVFQPYLLFIATYNLHFCQKLGHSVLEYSRGNNTESELIFPFSELWSNYFLVILDFFLTLCHATNTHSIFFLSLIASIDFPLFSLRKSSKAWFSTSSEIFYFTTQLQVPDDALSFLMSMGYKERNSKRALRMSNQQIDHAIDFLDEEKTKKARKREEDIQRRNEIMWV